MTSLLRGGLRSRVRLYCWWHIAIAYLVLWSACSEPKKVVGGINLHCPDSALSCQDDAVEPKKADRDPDSPKICQKGQKLAGCIEHTDTPDPEEPRCGNDKVESGEVCDDGTNDRLSGGCLPGCEEFDDSDRLFEQSLVDISISMSSESWEALRKETKTTVSAYGSTDCRTRESEKPYHWYSGDISINGEKIADVGVRKKGHFGSQSTLKPSLKIRFDKYIKKIEHLGLKRFALNNSLQDPTYMRGCLSYQLFRQGGVPAPRCTLARVTINGVEKGVYVLVEEIKKHFLSRHFKDNEGTLYEGESADFRPEYFGGFEQETNNKTDQSRPYLNDLNDVIATSNDVDFIEKLSTVLNMDQFYQFWAVEGLIWHRDSYSGNANNYFLYADPSDNNRFHFLPWGIDTSMKPEIQKNYPRSVLARGKITNRLMAIEDGKARYFEALDSLLDTIWKPDDILTQVDNYEELLSSVIQDNEMASFSVAVDDLRAWISGRRDDIAIDRSEGDPDWNQGLRRSPCRVPSGTIQGTFSTTWDTLDAGKFSVGEASISVELWTEENPTVSPSIIQSGASVGLNSSGQHRINMTVDTANEKRYDLRAIFPNERFFESYWVEGNHPINVPPLRMVLTTWDLSASSPVRLNTSELGSGQLSLSEVSSEPGGIVSGHFEATVYSLGN